MMQFIVLVGNIGTGKTYYSKNCFQKDYKVIRPDDYSSNPEQKQAILFKELEESLKKNKVTILDGLNLERAQRQKFLYFTRNYPECKKTIIDFGPGNHTTLQRVIKTRPEIPGSKWRQIYEENKIIYEKPSIEEGYDEVIEICNLA